MKLNPIRRGNCEGTAVDINDMVEFAEETETINDLPETNDAPVITYNIARSRRAKTFDADNGENMNFHNSILVLPRPPLG